MEVVKANNKSEIVAVVTVAANFSDESKYVVVDIDITSNSYWSFIESGIGCIFLLKDQDKIVGGLGAIKYPDLHSGVLTAVETFWYVLPEYRGEGLKLLDAYEQWASDNNCGKMAMIHMVDSMPKALEKLYTRRGYQLIEKHYVKEVPE